MSARSLTVTKRKSSAKPRAIEYVKVPKHWFSQPLLKSMKKLVRPATAKTRRRQVRIKMGMVMEAFVDLISPLVGEGVEGLEWEDENSKVLKPTAVTQSLEKYHYLIRKPSLLDKFWRMEEHELEQGGKRSRLIAEATDVRSFISPARLRIAGSDPI